MPLQVNLRHLEERNAILRGELPPEDLDLDLRDDMIRATEPLRHAFEVEMLDGSLLVQGSLKITLNCLCVRCLKAFKHELKLDPWTLYVPLSGEDATPVINDCVDLTPLAREDILLELPQHPLCKPDCGGLAGDGKRHACADAAGDMSKPTAWAALNRLKL